MKERGVLKQNNNAKVKETKPKKAKSKLHSRIDLRDALDRDVQQLANQMNSSNEVLLADVKRLANAGQQPLFSIRQFI